MMQQLFDEQHVLHALKHYLPTQTPLKDFIHHNSLHAFQHLKFYDAIFKGAKIFGFQATLSLKDFRTLYQNGRIKPQILSQIIAQKKPLADIEVWKSKLLLKSYDEHNAYLIGQLRAHWKNQFKLDLDNLVQPSLFRLLSSYLDQGIAIQAFPDAGQGFFHALQALEQHSFVSLFKTAKARNLLFDNDLSVSQLLHIVVGNQAYFEQYLFDQQFSHRGWSGMVATVEAQPHTLLSPKKISLQDLIKVELLLEIDALESALGADWQSLSHTIQTPPIDLFADLTLNLGARELHEVLQLWQDAFEWSYYDEVLSGIQQASKLLASKASTQQVQTALPSFQAMFCIDERECSIRRHIEFVDNKSETFGTPGFFSVEFYFQAQGAKFYDKLCPAPVTPKYLIKELNVPGTRQHDAFYTPKTHTLLTGFLSAFTFGFWAVLRLVQNLFRPTMSPAIANAFAIMHVQSQLTIENKSPADQENGLQIGFSIDEMVARVASLLGGIGLTTDFSPIVYAIAHGSSSANNPHHGAHDCGACSGRPGSVNARVFAAMANHPEVRARLKLRGIVIPETTQFIGGLHDTAADEIEFYDTASLSVTNTENHRIHLTIFESALDLNAKERSRRFASINTLAPIKAIRKAIKARSVSLFEPRPELGHGSNALCIVGRRTLTKNLFLDRRAFLNSYHYQKDLDGQFLTNIMKPLGPVCGGINLEYYFSRVDNYKMGAGTKLPHNVVGLFGVANSSDGDLRPGLPWQMVEVHDPVRLLIVVEHFPEIVLKAIKSTPEMYEWFANEWVHIAAVHPETHEIFVFKEGVFAAYSPSKSQFERIDNIHDLLEKAVPMKTNHIAEATKENFAVYLN